MKWFFNKCILGSIVVSIPACHAGDPGSIPGRGEKRLYCLPARIKSNTFRVST